MIVIDINPIFNIGPLTFHWYGLMYAVGITIGLLVVWPYARSKGITREQIGTIVFWAVPAGLLGGRLYYVIQQPLGPYLAEPWRILAFWEGGMAFYGAVLAVVITILICCKRMKISISGILDVTALFAVVGQFFGRIGNIINGDVLGYPTTLPWGVIYTNPNSFAPSNDIAYQPAAVYEALIDVILFVILWRLRDKLKPGILFFIYIIGYSVSQIIVFFWRDNEIVFLGMKQAQLSAIAVIIIAVAIFMWVYIRRRKANSTVKTDLNEEPPGDACDSRK